MRKRGKALPTLLLSLTLIASLLLSACSKEPGSTDPAKSKDPKQTTNEAKKDEAGGIDEDGNGVPDWQEKQITLTVAFKHYGEDDKTNALFLNAQKFSEKYPNIKVVRDRQLAANDSDPKQLEILTSRAMSGTMPDIFYSPLSAEMYDRELTLDLTPYLDADPESKWISDNARKFITTYDGKAIYGLPWQSVSQMPAINITLLKENNIAIPSYDWTYQDYENLRAEVAKLTPNNPIFPGGVDFSELGPHYFDSIPNGWKGFNSETARFDFTHSTRFGAWLDQFAKEDKQGLWFWDMPEAARKKKVGDTTDPWGDGLESIGNIWMYSMHDDVFKMVKNKKMDIDIYPMPKAPEGGTTSLHAYYDTLSLSSALAKDPVKAEAAYQLLKWLTYGGEGLRSRWSLVYEILGRPDDDPLKEKVLTKMVDWTLGWPVTTNPDVLKDNPFVKGFPEGSEAAALYNFPAFKNTDFQQMLSNPVPFPRNLPAVANVYDTFSAWKIRDEILKEGRKYSDIASGWDENLNKSLDNYLREYNKK